MGHNRDDPNARLRIMARRIAREEGIDPDLAEGLIHVESRWRPNAVSHAGAVGITQVLPTTARDIDPNVTRADLFDPETNMRIGFRYLRHMKERFGDDTLALAAYNMGPSRVNRRMARGQSPDLGYARAVLENMPKREENVPLSQPTLATEVDQEISRLRPIAPPVFPADASTVRTPKMPFRETK